MIYSINESISDLVWKYIEPITNKDISDFEKSCNIKIPSDLKKCIIENNAGSPNKHYIGDNYIFSGLLNFDSNKNKVESVYDAIEFMEPNVLPFGRDPFGNYYCIKNGRVVFWDHECDKFYNIANNFTAFLNMLRNKTQTEGVKESFGIFSSIAFI